MPELFNKKLFRFLFIVMMFFSCLKEVSAGNWYSDLVADIPINSHCSGRNCIPLCIYSEEKGAYLGIGENKYIERVLISYSTDQESYKWEINYLQDNFIADDNLEFVFGYNLPKNNIFWSGEEKTWENSQGYKELNEKFKCPGDIYINDYEDDKSSEKLCFDVGEQFRTVNEITNDFTSRCEQNKSAVSDPETLEDKNFRFTHLTLSYSFIDDKYSDVINNTISETKVRNDDIPDFSLLSNMDSEFNYESDLTKDNCTYLEEKLKNVNSYSTKIITRKNEDFFTKEKINPILKNKALEYGVRYPERYDFNILSKAMTGLDGTFRNLDEPNTSFSTFYDIYPERMAFIVSKAAATCNSKYDFHIIYSEKEILETFKEKHNKLGETESIRFDDEYDCGLLNGIEGIISTGYFIIELLSIIILIVFSVLDYSKVILNGDAEQMKKSNNNLFKRIIIVVVIFLLPAILNVALKLFKIEGFNSEHPLCVEIKK